MASIDQRIVSMVFENAKFEAGIKTSMDSLKKFNDALGKTGQTTGFSDIDKAASKVTLTAPMNAISKLRGYLGNIGVSAGQGFSDIDKAGAKVSLTEPITALNKVQTAVADVSHNAPDAFNGIQQAAGRVDFSGITNGLDNIQNKFSVMSAAAAVALGNIYTKAATVGAGMAKELTLGPVTAGFKNYETQIGAVQTILANTGLKGKSGLGQVNAALKDLNNYANLTVYNFSEMARNIGTFTAAGVPLKTATGAIKGIANIAAMSGSTSQQAGTAMYQLSQAIAAGRVSLQDWNSVVNAGMGGQVFQKALMETGLAMGTISKSAYQVDKATGKATVNGQTFRNSIMAKPGQQSWLTSKVLTTTLNNFTGDMKKSQLAAEGFSASQIKVIQDQAKTAVHSATNIKTLTQLFDALKEEVASSWSAVWKTVFGDINQATKLFSALHVAIENALRNPIDHFNKVLQGWAAMGGRVKLIEGLKQAFEDLMRILDPIKQAFRDIFPPQTSKGLYDMTVGFGNLMDRLKASPQTMANIRKTFDGLFAVLHIGWTIIKDVAKVLGDLLGLAGKGAGGILGFTGTIGGFLKALDDAISKGHALNGFFSALESVLSLPVQLIRSLVSALFGLFGGGNKGRIDSAKKSFDGMGGSLDTLGKKFKPVVDIAHKFFGILEDIKNKVEPVIKTIAATVTHLLGEVGQAIQHADFNAIGAAVQTGVLGGILVALRKGLSNGLGGLHIQAFTADLRGLNGVFGALTGNLKAMQKDIQANTMLQIAAAIGVLAAGVYVLSSIPAGRLTQAMTAVAVGIGELVGAMKLMTSGLGAMGVIQMPIIAASLIGMATAVTILAAAMKIFASMKWGEIAKGLVGVAGSLTALGVGLTFIGPSVTLVAPGLLLAAIAMAALGGAMKIFGGMKWGEIAKGLVGMGGALVAMGLGLQFMGPSILVVAPGLLVAAVAMSMLSGAVLAFGSIPLGKMILGLLGMGAAIAVLGNAIAVIPPTIAIQAVGLIVMAAALSGLAAVVGIFGKMNVATLAKGIIAMGASLVVLGIGLIAMEGGAGGAAALLLAAAGLAILGPAIGFLGTLNWGTIIKGLVAIVLVLGTLGVAGAIAAGPITALGIALLPLGAFFVVTAAAVWLFAKAIGVLASAGGKGLGILIASITAFLALIPHLAVGFIQGFLQVADEAAKVAPKVADALAKIITTVINLVIKMGPKLGDAIGVLLGQFVKVIGKNAPLILAAGFLIVVKLLEGIAKNIVKITSSVALIITGFLTALAGRAPDLVGAGVDLILSFLRGVASKAGSIVRTAITVVTHWLGAVAGQAGRLATAGVRLVAQFILGMAGHIGRVFSIGVDLVAKLLSGIASMVGRVVPRAVHIASVFIHAFANGLVTLADVAAKGLIDFLNGLATVIRHRGPQLRSAGWNLASAMVDGILGGFGELWHKITEKITDLAHKLPGWFRKPLGITSPSKVFHQMGLYTMQGLENGINAGGGDVEKAAGLTGKRVVDSMRKTMTNVPGLLDGIVDKNPTIKPVLDLSAVKKGAGEIGQHLGSKPLAVNFSASQAGAISKEKASIDRAHAEAIAAKAEPSVKFEQNNYSPEPLSTSEIYRRTNNQISKVRKAVGIHNR